MDILGVTFDVDGWFNSGNALHALLIYHDLTHEKILFKLTKYLDSFMKSISKFPTNETILIKFISFR